MTALLHLDPGLVGEARELAAAAVAPVRDLCAAHTTVSIERALARLYGLTGADAEGIPLVNHLVDSVTAAGVLDHGVTLPIFVAAARAGTDPAGAMRGLADGSLRVPTDWSDYERRTATDEARGAARDVVDLLDRRRSERDELLDRLGDPPKPWIYLIVATGDIDEDVVQAQAAARQGADIIAVIRSTGQSLLEHVPEGETHEGFAGTYATQANFARMRRALDEVSEELGRYVRLTNYASGLCMPEIAAMAGLERLDMMLNDCLYGIIFRDINPKRTFIDQYFSRRVHARAGIVINTGEDNYLTTADAVEAAHTVIASQLLNERFALDTGLQPWQIGLGHAFEIDPAYPDQVTLEVAHAALVRELFPGYPLKYMPPTKHLTGDIFTGYLLDGFFNLVGVLTGQSIILVGMLTEGVHTPWLSDRSLALKNVRYVRDATRGLAAEFRPARDGPIAERAHQVLADAVTLLHQVADEGLLRAIGEGVFANTPRPADGGRGLEGVIDKADAYLDPVTELLEEATR